MLKLRNYFCDEIKIIEIVENKKNKKNNCINKNSTKK